MLANSQRDASSTARGTMVSLSKTLYPGPEVIKLFSSSAQLRMKFQLLIKTKIPINSEVSCFKSISCINHAKKC